jgi:NTP pyrophosphatase (non-canonical NTP hydrolase)
MINEHDIKDMRMDQYQELAGKYQSKKAPPEERLMGLLEEAGEVAGVFKRFLRGDNTHEETMQKLEKELGDVLWYLSRVAADNGWTLSSIAQVNLDKLESRFIRKTILGNGDNR